MKNLEQYLKEKGADYPFGKSPDFDTALDIIKFVNAYVDRKRFPLRRLIKTYGKRTAREVLESRETNARGPCLDLGCLVFNLMKERGFDDLSFRVYRFKGFSKKALTDMAFCVRFLSKNGNHFNINMGFRACYITREGQDSMRLKTIFEGKADETDFENNSFHDYMQKSSYLKFKFLRLKYGVIVSTLKSKEFLDKPPLSIKAD